MSYASNSNLGEIHSIYSINGEVVTLLNFDFVSGEKYKTLILCVGGKTKPFIALGGEVDKKYLEEEVKKML